MRSNYRRLGDYIQEVTLRNTELSVSNLLGININKFFMPSVANVVGTDMSKYKIVKKRQFACNRMHVGRDKRLPVALWDEAEDIIVSPAYNVFEVIDEADLYPEYLMMWFSRKEFDRNAWFYTDADVRGGLNWSDFCNLELPVPSIEKQREIVKEYKVLQDRISLNNTLIQKLEDTAQTIYKQWFVDFDFPDENGNPYKSSGRDMTFNSELCKEIPKGWGVKSLINVVSYLNRGITPKYVEQGGIIVVNQKCVRDNSIDFKFCRRHDIISKKLDKEKYLQVFDIVINSTGDGTLGRVGLIKEKQFEMTVDTHVTIVRPSNTINPLYLWFNISSRTDEIENLAEGSTGQTELGRNNLGELKILIPDQITQKAFSEVVTSLISYSFKIEKEIPIVDSLKEILLQKVVMAK